MKKIENSNYFKNKKIILEYSKKIILKDGWSRNLLKKLVSDKFSSSDLIYFFPNGYLDILEFSLNEVNRTLKSKTNKINIINFPISKRIKKYSQLDLKF